MRVATIIQGFAPVVGGEQRLIQRWAPLWEPRGADTIVFTRRVASRLAIRERQPGLTVWRVPGSGTTRPHGQAAWLTGATAGVVASRPDVIQAMDLRSPTTIALAAARVLRVPVVAKVLSTGPSGDLNRLRTKPLAERRLRATIRDVSAFICMTEQIRDELLEHGVAEHKLHLMPNGVDADHYRPGTPDERASERRRLGIGDDELMALFCGRLNPVKRLDVVLEAFADLPGRVVFVGDGTDEQRLRELAEAPALRGRVSILPPVEDTAPLHRAADVYVSASQTEGMSVSVLEAMATGRAVVASPASGMDVLLGGGAGILAADAGAAALAAALREAADPARRQAIGERARERAQSRYSLQANADAMLALYESVRAAA